MTTVHRLLDDAFSGVEPTAEVQDLKEEIRGNLTARAAELEASGVEPDVAARRAFEELGDVRGLVAEAAGESTAHAGAPGATGPASALHDAARSARRNRVRPRPAFVVSVVVAAIVTAALLTLAVLALLGVLTPPVGATVAWLAGAGLGAGWIVAASLLQETTTNHPVPPRRALGYGAASACAVLASGLAATVLTGDLGSWASVLVGLAVVASAALFAGLGATQTNRKKAWVREHAFAWEEAHPDRFSDDPAAAARFGIYAVVIWLTAFVVFVVLGLTVGWAWSWLAFVVACAVMMLVLARMLFGASRGDRLPGPDRRPDQD